MKAVLGGVGLALSVLIAGCQQSENGEVTYSDYYIKAPIVNNTTTSGYITLINGKKEPVKLTGVSVSSDIAKKAELHGYKTSGNMMKMYEVDALELPPGKPIKLESGGYHVMLMGLKQPLATDSSVNVTFQFSDGGSLHVDMPVKSVDGMQSEGVFVTDDNQIGIKNVSARATMPGMSTTAAYMTIENRGDKSISLVEASSPLAKKTELHTTDMDNGVMKMREVPTLDIDAGGEVVLKPGGYHIMLMGLEKAIMEGDEVPVELKFSDGSIASLKVLAMKKIPGQHMAH